MTDELRQAVVHMVNVLGAPGTCPENQCQGCDYEMWEATVTGLEALGYLRRWVEKTGEKKNAAGGTCVIGVEHMDPEDPLDAWEAFMRGELGITLQPGWKTETANAWAAREAAGRLKSGQKDGEA